MTVVEDIFTRAYQLASDQLDATLLDLRHVDWGMLTQELTFYPADTGGGLKMLMASSLTTFNYG